MQQEEIKLPLWPDGIILYTVNIKTTQKNVRTDKINRIIVYKINVKKSVILFLMNM